jgi:hypothetical protein
MDYRDHVETIPYDNLVLGRAQAAARSLVCASDAVELTEIAADPQNAPSTLPLRPAAHAGAPGWGQKPTMVDI